MRPLDYRPDIDGLRAISVLAVMFYHAHFAGFSGGFVGVDVFFVISGFLITKHLSSELLHKQRISFSEFYARRFKRLLPALFLMVSATIALVHFVGIPHEAHIFDKSVKYALIGLANLFFSRTTGGYFDSVSDEMPLLHTWSLSVEEQFYLVWPLLLLGLFKMKSRRLDSLALKVMLVISVIAIGLSQWLIFVGKAQLAFYYMPLRSWELAAGGIIVFLIPTLRKKLPTALSIEVGSTLGLLLVLLPIYFYSLQTPFPGFTALPSVLGASLLIIYGSFDHKSWVNRLLSLKPMVFIGLLSYGMYLWHWPLLAIAKIDQLGQIPSLPVRWGILVLSTVLAFVSLKFIEQPFQKSKFAKKSAPWKILVGGALAMVTLIGCTQLVSKLHKSEPSALEKLAYGESQTIKVDCGVFPLKSACTVDRNKDLPASQKPYIAFWGDSHAMAYFPMMEVFAEKHPIVTTLFGRGSTPPLVPVEGFRIVDATTTKLIVDYNRNVMAEIKRLTNSRTYQNVSVIISGRYLFYLGLSNISVWDKVSYSDESRTKAGSLAVIRRGFDLLMSQLEQARVHKILVFLPFPEFKYDIKRCLSRNIQLCQTPRQQMEAYSSPITGLMKEITSRYTNVRLIDPLDTFCTKDSCPQVIESRDGLIPVVFDDDHISHSGALHFGRSIESDLKWLIQ